jgi:molybdate transport system substrate-binding protein
MRMALGLGAMLAVVTLTGAAAADLKVLTTGAMKPIVTALAADFEKETGHKVSIENDTAGGLVKRIEGGAPFDVIVLTPGPLDDFAKSGKVSGRIDLARIGVGVMVKAGAPKPTIDSVDALKRALLEAKSVAYIDPASGGSSGIYVERMLKRLGIADAIAPKAKLKQGGYVADLVVNGDAELGIHQISEILPVAGVTLVGPLPPELQNYTTYAAAVSTQSREPAAASALVKMLASPSATPLLKARGMPL